jgi:hypothetical protein
MQDLRCSRLVTEVHGAGSRSPRLLSRPRCCAGTGVACRRQNHAGHSLLHGGTGRRPVIRLGSPAAARAFLLGPGQRAACVKVPVRDRAGQCTDSCGAVVTAAGRRIVRSPPHAPPGNAACAPMTGTVRRGLGGRLLIAGEHHLRRVRGGIPAPRPHLPAAPHPGPGAPGSPSCPVTADRPRGAPGPPQAGPPAAAGMTIQVAA